MIERRSRREFPAAPASPLADGAANRYNRIVRRGAPTAPFFLTSTESMPNSLRARLLAACHHSELEARSKEPHGRLLAHGIRRGIVVIQAVPLSENSLTYLAMLKKAVEEEAARVRGDAHGDGVIPASQGLEAVLGLIEAEANLMRRGMGPLVGEGVMGEALVGGQPIRAGLHPPAIFQAPA